MTYSRGIYPSPISLEWEWVNKENKIIETHWGENNLLKEILNSNKTASIQLGFNKR